MNSPSGLMCSRTTKLSSLGLSSSTSKIFSAGRSLPFLNVRSTVTPCLFKLTSRLTTDGTRGAVESHSSSAVKTSFSGCSLPSLTMLLTESLKGAPTTKPSAVELERKTASVRFVIFLEAGGESVLRGAKGNETTRSFETTAPVSDTVSVER